MLFGNPSLFTRIALGKMTGFGFGLIGLICLPYFWPDAEWPFRFGILFWYATVGAVIGVFGVVTWHPVARLPMPWWFRAPLIGAWMNFVLVLLAGIEIRTVMSSAFGPDSALSSPYWIVLEGLLVGFVIGFICTRFGGEGRSAANAMSKPTA